jgi:hypothetical protein
VKLESKWLNWEPATQKLEKSAGTELTKLTKPPTEAQKLEKSPGDSLTKLTKPSLASLVDRSMAAFDPSEWEIEFHGWASTQCVLRDGCFGGVGSLFVHFAEWCCKSGSVPCNRETFEWLLADQGFTVRDGLCCGLILARDEAYRQCLIWPKRDR